jgi:hypothetical protein
MQAEKIVVTDNKPLANPPAFKEVHKNLFICLTTYSKHLHESFSQRLEAWKPVEDCLAANEFNSDDNNRQSAKAFMTPYSVSSAQLVGEIMLWLLRRFIA